MRAEVETIPPTDRASFARTAATSLLVAFGLPRAEVVPNADGSVLRVNVPADEACSLRPADVHELERHLEDTVLVARIVSLEVKDGGGRLSAYVRTRCVNVSLPKAPGRLIYSERGTGLRESDELLVKAKRFTVAYASADAVDVYVRSGNRTLDPAIRRPTGGAGRETYAGRGRIQLTIAGPGRWSVRVYEGA